jgi:hypothetical protein
MGEAVDSKVPVDLPVATDAAAAADDDATFGTDEKKLVAKLDRALIPLIMLLYTFSFLDR